MNIQTILEYQVYGKSKGVPFDKSGDAALLLRKAVNLVPSSKAK